MLQLPTVTVFGFLQHSTAGTFLWIHLKYGVKIENEWNLTTTSLSRSFFLGPQGVVKNCAKRAKPRPIAN